MRPSNIPTEYTQFLNPNALRGARLGLVRTTVGFNLPSPLPAGALPTPAPVVAAFDDVLAALKAAGAIVVDLEAAGFTGFGPGFGAGESLVLDFDFRTDVAKYFATRVGVPLAKGTLATAIAFNNANADAEMPFFNQDIFLQAESLATGPNDPQPVFGGMTYNQALADDKTFTNQGIDGAIAQFHLDAVIAPTDNPAWSTDLLYGDHFVYGSSSLGAAGGYPYVQVPAANVYGIPMGITFFGTAFSEPTLIALASGFEAATHERAKNLPKFTPTIPDDHIAGEPLNIPQRKDNKSPDGWHPHHM
jgi:amidase